VGYLYEGSLRQLHLIRSFLFTPVDGLAVRLGSASAGVNPAISVNYAQIEV